MSGNEWPNLNFKKLSDAKTEGTSEIKNRSEITVMKCEKNHGIDVLKDDTKLINIEKSELTRMLKGYKASVQLKGSSHYISL